MEEKEKDGWRRCPGKNSGYATGCLAVQSCRLKCLNVIVNYFSDLQKHTITIVVLTQGVSDVVAIFICTVITHGHYNSRCLHGKQGRGRGKLKGR